MILPVPILFASPSKTQVAVGQENHMWGQLGNGVIGLEGRDIYLNVNGKTDYNARPYPGYSYPAKTTTNGGLDLCWYMDVEGVFSVAVEFLGDAEYAPVVSTPIFITVGTAVVPYKPPGPNSVSYLTAGIWKATVTQGSENHLWGQLGDGKVGVPYQDIYVNVNGVTKTDARPFPNGVYTYPQKTEPNGGIDLCWMMDEPGTFEVSLEFLGADFGADGSLLPSKSESFIVTVVGPYIPPTAPIVPIPESSDRRIPNNRIGISLRPNTVSNPSKWNDYLSTKSGWTRVELNWLNIEGAGDGVYNFTDGSGTNWDSCVDTLYQNRIGMIGLLDYGHPAYTGAWNNPPTTQAQIDAWLRFVEAVVNRYKDRIAVWEIWNEENAPGFWGNQTTGPGMGGNAAQYTELLKQTSALIRSIDPTCKIILGGLWGNDCAFLKAIYDAGGRDYFDILGIHPYGGFTNFVWGWYDLPGWNPAGWTSYSPFDFPVLAKVHELMRYFNDGGKPIWITEYGWGLSSNVLLVGVYWGVYEGKTIQELYAAGIKMAYDFMNDKNIDFAWASNLHVEAGYKTLGNIEKIVIHVFDDGGDMGLYNADGTKRPIAWTAFANLAQTYNTETPTELATITGVVRDANTKQPIPNATVSFDSYQVKTAADGTYTVKVPIGSYTAIASADNYGKVTQSINIPITGGYTLDFNLPSAPPIPLWKAVAIAFGITIPIAGGAVLYKRGQRR